MLNQFKTALNSKLKENEHIYTMSRIAFMTFLSETTTHYCRQKIYNPDDKNKIMAYVRQLLKQYSVHVERKPIDVIHQLDKETSYYQNHHALLKAIQNKDENYITELLKNNKNNQIHHALQCAVYTENLKAVSLIFEYGLTTEKQKAKFAKRCLRHVVRVGSKKMLKIFLRYLPLLADDNGTTRPLVFELTQNSGRSTLIEPLVNHGMNVHARNKQGDTVLHAAAKSDYASDLYYVISDLVYRYKVNINATNNNKETPIYCAANVCEDNSDVITSLFLAGAEINPTTTCPPLFGAIRAGSLDNINILLKYIANPKASYKGESALDCFNQLHEDTFSPYVRAQIIKLFTPEPVKPTLIQRAKGVCQSIQKIFTR